ncbi:hypothetical protein BCR44DRAFT_1513050 [Catenaria anguillulae PL171]|uniref:Uncharacterized protein n=1 Tax=Catenaria anguillulae PL171 TaxID=765915 RepID=A0A1Y2HLU3_9FUNG|nr:hypothetical protein BCR44DRAFT_1513050 [Catenaria anguillulae PL171]
MSSSAVPITVAVVLSVLFCSIRAYYWYKARARPPPYSSDSSYDIENQAMIAGGGTGGQHVDQRPSSPPGPARPSSSLYHSVMRSVSFPTQPPTVAANTSSSAARNGAGHGARQNGGDHLSSQPSDTSPASSPSGSPCGSSTASHNNSSDAIHPATPPTKPSSLPQTTYPSPANTSTPAKPVPGLIQTAVSGSWLAMLKHQTYTRVASPTTPTPTSPSPASLSTPTAPHATPTPGPVTASTTGSTTTSNVPAPPMLVVQPCTPRPFAFHAPSPTTASPTSAATAPAAPVPKSRHTRRHPRRKSTGQGPMSLFRQMYAATPPLVETDEESEEEEGEGEAESERTGSGTSIVSESGDSFADSLVERGRLLPASHGGGKAWRAGGKSVDGRAERDKASENHSARAAAARETGSADQLRNGIGGKHPDHAELIDGSESASLEEERKEEDIPGSDGEDVPITGAEARDATNNDGIEEPRNPAKGGGKGRYAAKTAGKGSASPTSVKSVKTISKKSKRRSRRMSV